jgi:hypothetical protein
VVSLSRETGEPAAAPRKASAGFRPIAYQKSSAAGLLGGHESLRPEWLGEGFLAG